MSAGLKTRLYKDSILTERTVGGSKDPPLQDTRRSAGLKTRRYKRLTAAAPEATLRAQPFELEAERSQSAQPTAIASA